jgi:hypothetical protein
MAEPRRDPAPREGGWQARLAAGRPRRLLEVALREGGIDILEHYGDGEAERLVQVLARLGLKAECLFHSPCG